jgi:hypothetical protein
MREPDNTSAPQPLCLSTATTFVSVQTSDAGRWAFALLNVVTQEVRSNSVFVNFTANSSRSKANHFPSSMLFTPHTPHNISTKLNNLIPFRKTSYHVATPPTALVNLDTWIFVNIIDLMNLNLIFGIDALFPSINILILFSTFLTFIKYWSIS